MVLLYLKGLLYILVDEFGYSIVKGLYFLCRFIAISIRFIWQDSLNHDKLKELSYKEFE